MSTIYSNQHPLVDLINQTNDIFNYVSNQALIRVNQTALSISKSFNEYFQPTPKHMLRFFRDATFAMNVSLFLKDAIPNFPSFIPLALLATSTAALTRFNEIAHRKLVIVTDEFAANLLAASINCLVAPIALFSPLVCVGLSTVNMLFYTNISKSN